jgi:hypothetical protein
MGVGALYGRRSARLLDGTVRIVKQAANDRMVEVPAAVLVTALNTMAALADRLLTDGRKGPLAAGRRKEAYEAPEATEVDAPDAKEIAADILRSLEAKPPK